MTTSTRRSSGLRWVGAQQSIASQPEQMRARLLDFEQPSHVLRRGNRLVLADQGELVAADGRHNDGCTYITTLPVLRPGDLGDASFMDCHGVDYPLYAGSMANGIASEEMVIALAREGVLASFGAAGLTPSRLEEAIRHIQTEIPGRAFASCLIHSPSEPALEEAAASLYLQHGVRTVEASAFLRLTPSIVAYRASGLFDDGAGGVVTENHVIAKVSRLEVAERFLRPAPDDILRELVSAGRISETQARLAALVPMADDITVEADSGGHTDNRPLMSLLPSIQSLRDRIEQETGHTIRVGAAGGIGTPTSMLGAFAMGAAYVATGSINQSCVEAGTSDHCKRILAEAGMADVMMAPAADMFEMGVKLQVLKRGTLFPMRAQKLHEIYRAYESLEEIPDDERQKLEQQVFKRPLDQVWEETTRFFRDRDPAQIERAKASPKRRMALVFRWYLGLSSNWANSGEPGREMDYQIWCGPAMGAFNEWVRGTYLETPTRRRVADVTHHMMRGAMYLHRVHSLRSLGAGLPSPLQTYSPQEQD